jgi:hypothetical protein
MNVGPTKDGKIIPLFEERLRQLGQWLNVNVCVCSHAYVAGDPQICVSKKLQFFLKPQK